MSEEDKVNETLEKSADAAENKKPEPAIGPIELPAKEEAKPTNQKQLLFSSDNEDEKSSDNPAQEAPEPEDGKDSEDAKGSQPESGAEESAKPQNRKRTNPNNNKNNRPQQKNQQGGQLSNRKKKQMEWKAKQAKKQNRKDRFKVDGLNAEVDEALELGNLADFESLKTLEGITNYLSELEIPQSDGILNFNEVYTLPLEEIREQANATDQDVPSAANRIQLFEAILRDAHQKGKTIENTGVLEILSDGNGLLTYSSDSYRLKAMCAFVPAVFIKQYGLQRGHEIKARVIPAIEEAKCPLAVEILAVQSMTIEEINKVVPFTEQIPYYPLERIFLESDKQEKENMISMRVVDLISPIGFGQRGLIVAPPRTGKTILMQGIANSIQNNYPDAHLIILLVDERPEEVTDFKRRVSGEVISSTFDESAESHVHAAEMVIEKSRRMVEVGRDVIILLDSITRLARAYNTVMPNSGKILSGGVEANALQKPKRFFGSARNIEGGGSLTIIGTALVETGSKMDEVIFEEFKGTGNMELHLDRALVDKRIFPALSMDKSGTRKEELLYHPDELLKIYSLRRAMKGVPSTDAMEMLINRVKKSKSNAEFLMNVNR